MSQRVRSTVHTTPSNLARLQQPGALGRCVGAETAAPWAALWLWMEDAPRAGLRAAGAAQAARHAHAAAAKTAPASPAPAPPHAHPASPAFSSPPVPAARPAAAMDPTVLEYLGSSGIVLSTEQRAALQSSVRLAARCCWLAGPALLPLQPHPPQSTETPATGPIICVHGTHLTHDPLLGTPPLLPPFLLPPRSWFC